MTKPKPIQTVSRATSGLSPWYIKGSYVLDVVFRDRLGPVQHAADLDVFYLKGQGKPTKSDIEPVLQAAGLPPLPPKGIHGPFDVDDLSALDGVGRPVFNIDLWHIREDGSLKTRNQAGTSPASRPAWVDQPVVRTDALVEGGKLR